MLGVAIVIVFTVWLGPEKPCNAAA